MLAATITLAVVALALAVALILQQRRHDATLLRLQQAHSMDFGAFVARVVSSDTLAIAEAAPPIPARQARTYISDLPYDDQAWNELRGAPADEPDPNDFDMGAS
jgi:hypothetical protein